ncbi:MAG: ATP-binding protein [Candidatus Hydrothermarchaeales archaeon]
MEGESKGHHGQLKYGVESEGKGLESSYKELSLLHEINSALNTKIDLDEILQTIIDGVTSVFNYYSSGIYLLSEDGTHFILKNYSLNSTIIKKIEKIIGKPLLGYKIPLFEGSILKEAIEKGEPIITEDIEAILVHHTDDGRLRKLAKPIAKLAGLKSGVGVPLTAGNRVVGMLGVASKDEKMTQKDAERLKRFGDQAGLAIEKAKLYEELKEYSEHLEQMVEERTKELREKERQLLQSEKLAAIGKLAAGVAHEINNPLGNISLYTQMLLKKGGDEKEIESLMVIEEQVETAARIVRNLLEFSRQTVPKTLPLDINKEVLKSIKILDHTAYMSNIKIEEDFNPDLSKVIGDSGQLQQVFLNILTNAIQVTPKGGKVVVSTREAADSVAVEITDEGQGISEEIIEKIFDPFFTTKEVSGGTGLGLSVSLGIIERHGGKIKVKSTLGKGSKFIIELPSKKS